MYFKQYAYHRPIDKRQAEQGEQKSKETYAQKPYDSSKQAGRTISVT